MICSCLTGFWYVGDITLNTYRKMRGYRSDCSLHFIDSTQARYDGTKLN